MRKIHKFSPQGLGGGEVPGRPRTLGTDGMGKIAVYYETGEPTPFVLAFTGDDMPEGYGIADTLLYGNGLVYHLLTKEAAA